MSLFKRVVHPAILAMGLFVATALTMAVSSDRATAGDAPTGVLGSTVATDPVEQDWLHQADGQPTSWRIRREITWTRELADRLAATGNGPDLSAPLRGTKTAAAAPLCLGTRSAGSTPYRFQGCLDEVCLFDRALAPGEMQSIHSLGKKLIGVNAADKEDIDLYLAVRRVKRRMMMKNPLLDFSKVVFVDVPCYDALNHESMHRVFPQAQNNVGRLMTLEGLHPGGKVTDLTGQAGMPVRPRPVPRAIQDRVSWPGPNPEDGAGQGEEAQPGVLYSNDVFEGLPDELREKAKYVRVIHQDYIQLLDDQYRAVHIMRSFTGVMPGERRGCVGCHESQGTAPATAHSLALANGPVRPTPPPWGPRYHLGYRQDVQPILDRHCGKCHQGDGKGREKLDMTFRPSTI